MKINKTCWIVFYLLFLTGCNAIDAELVADVEGEHLSKNDDQTYSLQIRVEIQELKGYCDVEGVVIASSWPMTDQTDVVFIHPMGNLERGTTKIKRFQHSLFGFPQDIPTVEVKFQQENCPEPPKINIPFLN